MQDTRYRLLGLYFTLVVLQALFLGCSSAPNLTAADKLKTMVIRTPVPIGDALWNGKHYFAVGDGGNVYFINTEGVITRTASVGSNSNLWGATYGKNTYVAVGAGRSIYTSSDGGSWIAHSIPNASTYIYDVTYSEESGKFAATGDGGTVVLSNDATDWQDVSPGLNAELNGIAYANGYIITVGRYGTIFVSNNDGKSWIRPSAPTSEDLRGVVYGNGYYIIAGGESEGYALISQDPERWDTLVPIAENWIWDIAFGDGVFVAVGQGGTIVYSKTPPYRKWEELSGKCKDLMPSYEWWHDVSFADGRFVIAGWDRHMAVLPTACF